MFSGGIERDQWQEMGLCLNLNENLYNYFIILGLVEFRKEEMLKI